MYSPEGAANSPMSARWVLPLFLGPEIVPFPHVLGRSDAKNGPKHHRNWHNMQAPSGFRAEFRDSQVQVPAPWGPREPQGAWLTQSFEGLIPSP